jgi:hypothetical protein
MALRRTLIQCAVSNCNNSILRSRARHVSSIHVPSEWSPRTRTWLWQLERSYPLSTVADSPKRDEDNGNGDNDNGESALNESKIQASKAPPIQQIRDEQWEANYEKVKEIFNQHGRNESSAEFKFWPDKKVAQWLDKQKHLYRQKRDGKANTLTDEREQKLLALGIKKVWERHWMQRYEKLRNFVEERGCFPHECEKDSLSKEDFKLFVWCNKQRQRWQIYKKGLNGRFTSMTEERQEKLADIGFCFDLYEETWMERYGELQEYSKHHGDCLVPHVYTANPQLGRWVKDQRHNNKVLLLLTTERIDLLNKLDFVWDVPDMIWNEKYILLEEHVRINGLGSLPPWKDNNCLRRWAANQQKLFQNRLTEENTMTKERIQKLDKLGFPWNTSKTNPAL